MSVYQDRFLPNSRGLSSWGRRTKAGVGDERGEFAQEDDGGNGLRENLTLYCRVVTLNDRPAILKGETTV